MGPRRVVEKLEGGGRTGEHAPRLRILGIEQPKGIFLETPAVLRTEARGVRADVLLQGAGEAGARFALRNAVDRRREVRQAERAEELEEHPENLGVSRGRGDSDELDADLAELAVPARLRLLVAKLGTRVPEADRPRNVLHSALDERPDHSGGVLGAKRQRAALAVRERVHLLVDDVRRLSHRAGEELRRLEDRRADLSIPVRAEDAARGGLDGGELLALGGKEVVRALRRLHARRHRAQAPSTRKYSSL